MKKVFTIVLSAFFVFTLAFCSEFNASAAAYTYAGKVVTDSGRLNVRSSASGSASVITSVAKSSWVTIKEKSGSWYKVEYSNGKHGWCHSDYIKKYDQTYPVTVSTSSGKLNVRTGAGTGYSVQDKLSNGEAAVVLYSGSYWSRILYHGSKIGYAHNSYLKQSSPSYNHVSLSVPSFKQTDLRWASYPLGTTGGTIGKIGCTTTALAMVESYHTGKTVIPKDMAKKLSYSASGSLYWPSTHSVEFAGSDYLSRIHTLLRQGKPVVFGAKKSSGIQHWVTVTGYNGSKTALSLSGFTVNDPGSNTRKTLADFLAAYPNIYKIVYRK